MRLDSNGKVTVGEVGTDTTLSNGQPSFQVTGSGFGGYAAIVRRDNGQYGPGIILAKSRNTTADSFTIVQDDDDLGSIVFIGDDGTNLDTYGATITASVDGTPGQNDLPTRLTFSTTADGAASPTERMRIASDGRVAIGNTNPSDDTPSIGFQFDVSDSNVSFLNIGHTSSAGTSSGYVRFVRSGTVIGQVRADGVTNVLFATSSDYRLKENIVTEWDATSRLKQLKPSRFNFKEEKDRTRDGFIAHEVSSIVPEAVGGEKDAVDKDGNIDPQGIDHSKLVPLMVKTIQELEARIAALEAK